MNRFSTLLAYSAALMLSALGQETFAQRIVLKNETRIQPGWVRLGNLASIETSDASKRQILQNLPVRTFNGKTEVVSRQEIADLLRSQGLDLVYWKLQGARSVRIIRSSFTRPVTNSRNRLSTSQNHSLTFPQSTFSRQPARKNSSYQANSQPTIDANRHRRALYQEKNGTYPSSPRNHSLDDRSMIRTSSGGLRDRPSWSQPARTVRQTPKTGMGSSPAEQRVFNTNHQQVQKKEYFVWGAKETIPAGKLISPSMLKSVITTQKPDPYFQDASSLLGREASYRIQAGKPIRRSSVRIPRVIRRNDKIRLHVGIGAFSVSRIVIAMEDGGIGETIKLRSADRKKTYFGKVIRAGVVVMTRPN